MRKAQIFYARVDEFWRKEEKYQYLEEVQHVENVNWQLIQPDKKHTWLTEGLRDEFESFIEIGSRQAKSSKELNPTTIFKVFSSGVKTNRDAWTYNFSSDTLSKNAKCTVITYNEHIYRWSNQSGKDTNVDEFVIYDDSRISWGRDLKLDLKRGRFAEFSEVKIRHSLYRPFTKSYLFFDKIFNEEVYVFPSIFPATTIESENQVICLTAIGNTKKFQCLTVNVIPDIHLTGDSQCFPFYTYDDDGTNRRENITNWALEQFRTHYQDNTITKWDIFYCVYAVLHHPLYRERYAANLRRELPRIPYAPDFHAFARAGKRLAEIHVEYEQQPEYPLRRVENNDLPLDWRVEKMKLTKDKTAIVYNDFLILSGILPETFNYRLGNRSALEWVIDQYQVSTDKRSGIVNDPNRLDDPEYIARLVGQVITVSLETVQIVNSLPDLGIPEVQI